MQKTVYLCDACDKDLGNNKNFSLNLGRFSGVALPPDPVDPVEEYLKGFGRNRWTVHGNLSGKFLHFCTVKCLTKYFSALFKQAGKLE